MIGTLPRTFTEYQIEIIKAVLYFDVFNYPLTGQELYENSAVPVKKEQFDAELRILLEQQVLKLEDGFILNATASRHHISKRLNGNEGAAGIMPVAYAYSRKIASFPFVEGVCLSGGLSKNYYDKSGDIDYFIITRPDRLWICRTLLILRYKLLPENKKKYWCTNYFISSDNMEIPDVNAFTGTELAYLIPTINYTAYKKLIEKNEWYRKRFPNKRQAAADKCDDPPRGLLKRGIEFLLSGHFGTWLDNTLLYITLKHWQKKYPELSSEDFELQFRSRKNVCKRHTKGFQNRVLKVWEDKQREFEIIFNTSLR